MHLVLPGIRDDFFDRPGLKNIKIDGELKSTLKNLYKSSHEDIYYFTTLGLALSKDNSDTFTLSSLYSLYLKGALSIQHILGNNYSIKEINTTVIWAFSIASLVCPVPFNDRYVSYLMDNKVPIDSIYTVSNTSLNSMFKLPIREESIITEDITIVRLIISNWNRRRSLIYVKTAISRVNGQK